MLFDKEPLFATEIKRESGENVLYVNFLGAGFVPSISSSPQVMARTLDLLSENTNVSRLVFVQQRNYSFSLKQVNMLIEIVNLYNFLTKTERILSEEKLRVFRDPTKAYNFLSNLLNNILKQDPVLAYRLLKDEIHRTEEGFYKSSLEELLSQLKELSLIKEIIPLLGRSDIKEREFYSEIFRPDVIPNFTFTREILKIPENCEIVEEYTIGSNLDISIVSILKEFGGAKLIYHISSSEYSLEDKYHTLLSAAKDVLAEHRPTDEEFNDVERTRQVFFNVARDLIQDLSNNRKIAIKYSDVDLLANILVRNTIGFGILEVLLQDPHIQDLMINAPSSKSPIFIKHSDFGECISNIVVSQEDVDSWASKFRMLSGRPLDEAHPVLDTSLNLNNMSARVAIVQQPLSPEGVAYTLRRHRDKPWTLPLFIKNKMLDGLSAGLLSFLVDGARTMLVAGTRSSGKTSLLGSLLLEIMPRYRIISVEDSVTGDSKILIKENGNFRETTIGELIDKRIKEKGFMDVDGREKELNLGSEVEVFSMDREGKVVLSKPSKFIKHKTNKKIFRIKTKSGKEIKVTEDHSLFTFDSEKITRQIKSKDIKKGTFIALPGLLPLNSSLEEIDISENDLFYKKRFFVFGKEVEEYLKDNQSEIISLGRELNYSKSVMQNWFRKKMIPSRIFFKIKDKISSKGLCTKLVNSQPIPFIFKLDKDLLNFFGLWLADGCYDAKSIIISVQEEENKKIVKKIAQRFNLNVCRHSDKFSSMINSSALKTTMQNIFNLKGDSYTKKIPDWTFNLSAEQIGWLLQGYFSGDGCATDKEITFSSCSKNLIEGISSLLLRFGIVLRISNMKARDKTYRGSFGSVEDINIFSRNIGFLTKDKNKKMDLLSNRISTHDSSKFIPFSLEDKNKLKEIFGKRFNSNDYIKRGNKVGRNHLIRLIDCPEETEFSKNLKRVLDANIFWDSVKEIEEVKGEGFVYDLSVPGCENFICNNVLAHNTLELPINELRKLDYDVLSMKVRSALTGESNEVSAEEGIRASLRLGDSSLIVGEIRSDEAKALYEAMRVGALANVVAGTIHGGSPYSVFDRVVNDLGVPVTSFKATDCIVIVNPIKSADGMKSWRRLLQLTEVRKHWSKDPLEEGGFVDLMKYDVEKDKILATPDLINGDSEMIKSIAANVRGWAGNWDAVWDNILLRQKIKEGIVNLSENIGNPDILEAGFCAKANNAFHEISEDVMKEVGLPVSERVFPEWQKWLDDEVKRLGI